MSRRSSSRDEPQMRADARRNRERILAAAGAVIAEAGADASLEEIARRAGVGSATLHRHFASRAELLQATFHDRIAALCDRAEELAEHADGATALVAWLRELVAHAAATRGLVAALVESPNVGRSADSHQQIRRAGQRLLSRAQGDGSVSDDIRVDDVLHLANGVVVAAEALGDAERSIDRLMGIVVNGLVLRRRLGPLPKRFNQSAPQS